MKRLAFFALSASAVCAVAFSPGPEILLALTAIALVFLSVAAFGHSPPTWLKSIFFSLPTDDLVLGHGHINSGAFGLGAGGRQALLRSILAIMMLAVLAVVAIWRFITSAGHAVARTNTSAQPLPL